MASDAERTCGWCEHFAYLTDDERRGICLLEMRDALGIENDPMRVLDWTYDNARRPDEVACEEWGEAR